MDNEQGLKKVEKWHGTLFGLSIVFAIVTFILWAGLNGPSIVDYVHAVARFWASFSLTVFFVVISITVKKIHKYLKLVNDNK